MGHEAERRGVKKGASPALGALLDRSRREGARFAGMFAAVEGSARIDVGRGWQRLAKQAIRDDAIQSVNFQYGDGVIQDRESKHARGKEAINAAECFTKRVFHQG